MLGFIVAAALGFITPQLEKPVGQPVAKFLKGHTNIEDNELRLLTFMIVLLVAGVVAALLNSGSAFWIVLGSVLGYFGQRIVEAVKKIIDARNNAE